MGEENEDRRDRVSTGRGVLSENVVETRTAQDKDGTIQVSLPKDSARDLGIQKGDTLIVKGESGDRALRVEPSETVFGGD